MLIPRKSGGYDEIIKSIKAIMNGWSYFPDNIF
jgi:hypothetical protein